MGTKIRKEVGKAFSKSQHFIMVGRAVLCPAHEHACLQFGADPSRPENLILSSGAWKMPFWPSIQSVFSVLRFRLNPGIH